MHIIIGAIIELYTTRVCKTSRNPPSDVLYSIAPTIIPSISSGRSSTTVRRCGRQRRRAQRGQALQGIPRRERLCTEQFSAYVAVAARVVAGLLWLCTEFEVAEAGAQSFDDVAGFLGLLETGLSMYMYSVSEWACLWFSETISYGIFGLGRRQESSLSF